MSTMCLQCGHPYAITPDDLAFYEKVSPVFGGKRYYIPPPTLCPDCRLQRRLCFRNERTLYHRKCDRTGKQMIAMHPADSVFPVYYIREWLSDAWDARDFGRAFDFNRPFFEQFKELSDVVPHFNLFIDPQMDLNSEFTNCSSEAKNCYMISQAEKNEDSFYARGINRCKDCCDCLRVQKCELCYECINAADCYRCLYCQDCSNCSECSFSTDLRGCTNCFGCHSLQQKQHCIFNAQVTREEWEEKVGSLTFSHAVIDAMKRRSAGARLTIPKRFAHILQCERSSGDHLIECKNARNCFDSRDLEDCAHCHEVLNGAKDCMDFAMWGEDCELLYECVGCGYSVHSCVFVSHCWQNISNLLYCDCCFPSVRDCFGCFGLKHARYCILNKQYTKEEYEDLVPRIIEHMRKDGSWGQFFPPSCSPFCYNESNALMSFPLTKEEALRNGFLWRDEESDAESYLGPEVEIPETIGEVTDHITKQILRCTVTGKPYKIIPQELRLYRTIGLPIPRLAPDERSRERLARRNPCRLWKRECGKCGKRIETSYAPDRPEIVYCEECYLSTVY